MGNFKKQMKLIALAALVGSTSAAACTFVTAVVQYTDNTCATKTDPQVDADNTAAVTALNTAYGDACTVKGAGSYKLACTKDGVVTTVYKAAACPDASKCTDANLATTGGDSDCLAVRDALLQSNGEAVSDDATWAKNAVTSTSCISAESKFWKATFSAPADSSTAAGSSTLALGVGLGLVAATLY